MVFSSAIFLFCFFPAIFIIYHIVPGITAKNIILILASLIFYSFGQPVYLLLLLASVMINYIGGVLIHAGHNSSRISLAVTLILNLALLGVFKYAGFAVENINRMAHTSLPVPDIVLPIGISFFTFQGMSYIVDVYRDRTLYTGNFAKLLLYISFFPQLIAGPVIKYHDVSEMIDDRHCTLEDTSIGIRRFIIGLSKKLLLANTAGAVADSVFTADSSSLDIRLAWLGAVCYTLQIYFDFSGYSDMAIGMGRIFGFRFLENFNYPYVSTSIKEFWRRWHISLSSWFRDYLYIPLGGSYCSKFRTNINKFIVFFTTGLWHGANWTFVLWGLWHGMFSILEDTGIIPARKFSSSRTGRFIGHIYTMLVVILGFTLFRADSLGSACTIFKAMFSGFAISAESSFLLNSLLTRTNVSVLILAVILSVDWLPRLERRLAVKLRTDIGSDASSDEDVITYTAPAPVALEVISYVGVFALFIYDVLNLSQATFNPFIYFQF
jgi:alginate O-acetyltransferase complex protein AlgI